MSPDKTLLFIYLAGAILAYVVRIPFVRRANRGEIREDRLDLLVRHWIYGLAGLPAFALVFFYRLPRGEAMMIKTYGDEYREYMRRVGGVLPKLR